MPRPEVVAACPHCGAGRRTRAQRGVWIACLECGEQFRRPADIAVTALPAPAGDAPAAPATAPARAAGSVTVERATPVVAQTARPRARAGEASGGPGVDTSAPARAEASSPARGEASDPPAVEELLDYDREAARRPPQQEKARAAGRRGGLAVYKGMTG
jgi:hypothetical protein